MEVDVGGSGSALAKVSQLDGQLLPAEAGLQLLTLWGQVSPGGGYIMGPDVGPMGWTGLVTVAADVREGWQWVLADLLLDGSQWEGVKAVDVATGQPHPDVDDAYDPEVPTVVPFDYWQTLGELEERVPRARQYRLIALARRFTRDPDSSWFRWRPEWEAARVSHFEALVSLDLPWRLVDGCLRKAGRPQPDGMSLRDIVNHRNAWYAEKAEQEAEQAGLDTVETVEGDDKPKGLTWRAGRKRYRKLLASWVEHSVPGVPAMQAEEVSEAVLWWLFHEAKGDLLEGALGYDGDDPWEPATD